MHILLCEGAAQLNLTMLLGFIKGTLLVCLTSSSPSPSVTAVLNDGDTVRNAFMFELPFLLPGSCPGVASSLEVTTS